ncbi:hypothetical protein VM1G_04888 [Cytospora mali]|uniref:Uncharacterized protein n=1 Tax=Cytospora mali TaxID=578113 RepID=A0A194VZY4_CYTMA|nr:hypothetical protein VM1G_04888 [Valsa mali]
MFGSRRRHRPPNPPFNASTANPNAATAAASAFHRRSPSNVSLSAAAAAAALKARPTTPINVANVQTKRTQRRSASQSSSAGWSTPDTGGRPGHLRRQSSSGSMTERSFRSPSPGSPHHQRSLSSGGVPRNSYQSDEPPPPVPAIPASVNMEAAKKQGTRPKSLGIVSTPVRTASQKAKDKTGPWFGAAKQGDMSNVRTSDAIMTTPPLQTSHVQDNAERPESGGSSVNFSYPARIRVASPTPSSPKFARPQEAPSAPAPAPQMKQRKRAATMSPQRGGSLRHARSSSVAAEESMVYDPNSRRMVPRAELLELEYQIQAASEARPKKKKQTPTRAGSHLAKGTVGRTQGTAVDHGAMNDAQLAAAESMRSHRVEERQPVAQEPEEQYQQPIMESVSRPVAPEWETEIEPQKVRHAEVPTSPTSNAQELSPARPSPTKDSVDSGSQRRPSVVKEETEESESESEFEAELEAPTPVTTLPNTSYALDSVPVRQNIYANGVPSPPRSDPTEDRSVESHKPPVELAASSTQPPPEPSKSSAYGESLGVVEPQATRTLRRQSRSQSISPARTARFGTVQESLTVRHEPPPRSISPRKSALKQQSPSRGASPTGLSEASDTGTAIPESMTSTRKKSVRVSFDDENTVVVGEAAGRVETSSPVPPSPQVVGRRPWYNNLKLGKKKDAILLDDDEMMKPRPVLPTFGSIRGRKSSPPLMEERPLVRPTEPSHDISVPVGQSSDHALGGLLHDQGPKNEANISKFREPLPPIVTSIEGNGFDSDAESLDSDAALMADTPKLESEESRVSEASTMVTELPRPLNGSVDAIDVEDFAGKPSTVVQNLQVGEVPIIAITQPSPRPSEIKQEQASYVHFPGGFPDTDTETDTEDANAQTQDPSSASECAPVRRVTFEPVVQKEDTKSTIQTPSTVLATQPVVSDRTDESDESSVYSDAYEDLAEVEGDGFQSLDAIVDSPLVITPPKSMFERAHAQREESVTPTPTSRASNHAAVVLATEKHTGKPIDDWEAAKAYWRSLTADRKAQLEKEAAEDAAEEGDLEEVKQDPRPRRKKSLEKRTAEKKAIEQQRATADPDRNYIIRPSTKADEHHPPTKGTLRSQSVPSNAKAGLHLRKTMRGAEARPVEAGTGMRKSLRSESLESSKLRRRPVSYQPSLGTTTEIASSNRHVRSMSEDQSLSNNRQPRLRRRGSDESTSSFKRSRATGQGFGFRKTLRADTSSPVNELRDQQSSRFSVRSMSPPVSMRTTLRGDPGAQRRSSQDSGKSYLHFPRPFGHKGKVKKASRFSDESSSDEEVAHQFSSRFGDSSDEDVTPQPLPPRTIARTMRGGKTTKEPPSPPLPEEEELSDGDDVGGDESPQATALSSGGFLPGSQTEPVMRDGKPTSRRGFMSSVLRRNKKRGGGISRPGPVESAARRDTNLERSADELNALRSKNGTPRLQKRTASLPVGGSSWPLPGNETEAEAEAEVAGDEKQEAASEHVGDEETFDGVNVVEPEAAGKKKKKFGALRRMFNLYD